jgi:hypothetical protein
MKTLLITLWIFATCVFIASCYVVYDGSLFLFDNANILSEETFYKSIVLLSITLFFSIAFVLVVTYYSIKLKLQEKELIEKAPFTSQSLIWFNRNKKKKS